MIPLTLGDVIRHSGATCDRDVGDVVVRRVGTDSRLVEPGDLFVALRGERTDGHHYVADAASRGAVACLVESRTADAVSGMTYPGRPVPLIFVEDAVKALGQLAGWYRREMMSPKTVVVGVTGSNGKTTTKQMIDHVLKGSLPGRASPRSFNNAIGVPLSLLSAEQDDRYLVVEIGTNAPGEIATLSAMASPQVGVITSIGEAHLEGLGTIAAVSEEKAALLEHTRAGGLAVVNVDRPEIHTQLGRASGRRLITFGFDARAHRRVETIEADLHGSKFTLDGRFLIELGMPGPHHATNAAAAFVVAQWFGVSTKEIGERLATFQPSDGRTRVIHVGEISIVDDSYNANPGSMAAATAAMRGISAPRRVFVMGDMMELGPRSGQYHERVVRNLIEAGVEFLVTVGPMSAHAAETVFRESAETLNNGRRPGMLNFETAEEASQRLRGFLEDGDVIWIKASRAMALDRVVKELQATVRERVAVA